MPKKSPTRKIEATTEPITASATSAARAGAILTIDLAAIRDNYEILCRVGAVACAAVVKADAYGLGADRVGPALEAAGCTRFFVAHLAEAESLRRCLRRESEIAVLNGLPPGSEGEAAAAGVLPVLNGIEQVAAWGGEARRLNRRLGAILQVDSGMSRLGLSPAEVERLSTDPAALQGIDIRLVMSHLACSDEPGDPANERQRQTFESLRRRVPPAPASLANSSAIFLGSPFHFDEVRPGAALYGINPTPARRNPMRPVVGLAAKVIQLREIEAGTGVGYGHAFVAEAPMRLATLSIGYADGWHRRASTASAFLGTARLPFVGRVSMDSVIVDATVLPEGLLQAGMLVDLLGPQQDVDAVASLFGTIGYEVLTSLGRRFARRYQDD